MVEMGWLCVRRILDSLAVRISDLSAVIVRNLPLKRGYIVVDP
jgi:hypothetical protein